ncbi:MAG: glycosyltransferase family 4 protein [Fusobacteriaceae bacterium]
MKIMFVANKLWDVYIFRKGVILAFVKLGYEVIIVAPDDKRIDLVKELGVKKVIDISVDKRGINPIKDIELFMTLKKIYSEEKPNLIFHYTIKLNIYGSLAAKSVNIKSIAVLTGLGYSFIKGGMISKIAKILYRISLNFSEEVFVLNEDDRKILIDNKIVKKEKIYVIPGEGIDTKQFKPKLSKRVDGKIVFLMIARAFYDKGFSEYAQTAEIIKEKYPNTVFKFLGALDENSSSGINKESMNTLVEKGILEYLGVTNDVSEVIKDADCIVLPSYREGISMVLLEGAAMEKIIVATDVTGCKEIVIEGETGFLVEPKSVQSLVGGIEKFLKLSQEKRIKFEKKAREKVINEFDETKVVEIYKEKVKNYGA